MNTIYGYWRCSTDHQDQERQIRALKDAGCEKIVGDKITGTSNYGDREELSTLLAEIQEGDLLILSELSRLGRTSLLMQIELDKLIKKGVNVRTLDKRLDTTSMSKEIVGLIVSIMGYCAEQELSQIKSRTSEGRAVALSRGVKFGRKRKYDQYQIAEVMQKKSEGQGLGTIAKSLGMSRSMVQRIVRQEVAV
jgi:DNA invertase Pin-like site-specific DNA recombinase|tara:strand:- start:77 stop:655 length:579 start_codon:yes stop_codon:yes gene_type:complete